MKWTEDRADLLIKLWREGLSGGQIANRLGGVTRNAVIGKVHRLGLAGQRDVTRARKPPKPRRNTPTHPSKMLPPATIEDEPVPEVIEFPDPVDPPVEPAPTGPCTMAKLTAHTCRWPLGDPGDEDFCFCGARAPIDRPYCEHHAALAYTPVDVARRRRRKDAA